MVFFIIAAILLVVACGYLFNECENEFLAWLSMMAICIATCCLITGIDEINNRPKPIDVYRGKTTLKITYENNVPVDTTVVFKSK